MKRIIIDSNRQKIIAIDLIKGLNYDGKTVVEIKNNDTSSTAKQRRLNWLWCTEVSKSGIGSDDTKEGVHIRSKYMFARPILLRDNITFGAIYSGFSAMIEEIDTPRDQLWREFTRDYISTERMTRKQRAEYLREFELYWRGNGVNLSIPATQGLDDNLGWKKDKL